MCVCVCVCKCLCGYVCNNHLFLSSCVMIRHACTYVYSVCTYMRYLYRFLHQLLYFIHCLPIFLSHMQHEAIRDAAAYLYNYMAQVDLSDMCTYSLALTTYALTTVGNSSDEHRYHLKKAIRNSVDRKFITYRQAEQFNQVLQY